jgi:hypothetical protein
MQKQAREAYQHFQVDPNHPGPRFKKVHPTKPIYSARVGKGQDGQPASLYYTFGPTKFIVWFHDPKALLDSTT